MVANSRALGSAFSFSDDSVLNSCIPPIFKRGRIDIAITIIPIPPSHCSKARQIKRPGGASSSPTIVVEPVVVMPDIDSNNESVKLRFSAENQRGMLPKSEIINHDVAVIRKPCLADI